MAQSAPHGVGERVLVVEDDTDVREMLCQMLSREGFQPLPAENGEAGLARVSEGDVDIIVLDVMLPGLSGFEVCRKLKFSRETNLIPIVLLTALDTPQDRTRGLWVGADRYLTKPFEFQELLAELRGTLEHRRQLIKGHVRTWVKLEMQSDGRLREHLNDLLSELFLTTPLPEEDLGRIRYAAMEMVANAIEWGNRKQAELTVTCSYELTDELVKFVVSDEGTGFNPAKVPHAASDNDPVGHMTVRQELGLRDGGFGIMIARGMVDKVEYNDAGNQVTLIKYLKPRETKSE